MKVKQPDLYYCDVCGKQEDKDNKFYKDVPVLSYRYGSTEYGVVRDNVTVNVHEFDLCEDCLKKAVGIAYAENAFSPGYALVEFKKDDPEQFKVNF